LVIEGIGNKKRNLAEETCIGTLKHNKKWMKEILISNLKLPLSPLIKWL